MLFFFLLHFFSLSTSLIRGVKLLFVKKDCILLYWLQLPLLLNKLLEAMIARASALLRVTQIDLRAGTHINGEKTSLWDSLF